MNIEIDYIEGRYPSVDFYVLRDYYESHTHLRLDFAMAPTGIPDLYDGNYSSAEIVRLGQVDGYFANRGNRWWFWCLYVPWLEGGWGGWYLNSDRADPQDHDPNGWNRWVSTVQWQSYLSFVPRATSHEWGHVMHCHEGYDELTCECPDCVYNTNPLHNPLGTQICQYHWYETLENTPNHPYHVPLWSYDWWLE